MFESAQVSEKPEPKIAGTPEVAPGHSLRHFIQAQELANAFGITGQAVTMAVNRAGIPFHRWTNRMVLYPSATRDFLTRRGIKYPTQVISFQMLKGGSTKTSSAFNLAVRLVQYGARVLCIDLDMQANLTQAFGIEVQAGEDGDPVMFHVLNGQAKIEECIKPVSEGLDLIPSSYDNSSIEFLMMHKNQANPKKFISAQIQGLRSKYDFILFDCNPSLSALNISIALASDQVIIPVNPDKFSSEGLKKTLGEFGIIAREFDKEINYKLLFTLYDGREASSQRYLVQYASEHEHRIFGNYVRRNADVKNAIDRKQSIFDLRSAPAREDYDMVAREMLGILGLSVKAPSQNN